MNTSQLHKLAAVLMGGGALAAFARENVAMLRKHEETAHALQQKLADEPRGT